MTLATNLMCSLSIGCGGCLKIIQLLARLVAPQAALPCRSSLRYWKRKVSYAMRRQTPLSTQGRWSILYDISITIGKSKVLLIVGVNLDDYHFSQPLRFADCRVLYTGLAPSWPAESIVQQLNRLHEQGYEFAYAVGDQGANIKKAAEQVGLSLINDCSHWLANLLRRKYENRPDFKAFEASCTALKRRGTISHYAHVLPPKHCAHSRFMNIHPLLTWARRMLYLLDHHRRDRYFEDCWQQVEWLLNYRGLIEEMTHSIQLTQLLSGAFKDEGFHEQSRPWARRCIQAVVQQVPIDLCRQIWGYVEQLEEKRQMYGQLICSTDIAESYFGYLKQKPAHVLHTEHLNMALYQRHFEQEFVQQSMESITVAQLQSQNVELPQMVSVAEKRRYLNKMCP